MVDAMRFRGMLGLSTRSVPVQLGLAAALGVVVGWASMREPDRLWMALLAGIATVAVAVKPHWVLIAVAMMAPLFQYGAKVPHIPFSGVELGVGLLALWYFNELGRGRTVAGKLAGVELAAAAFVLVGTCSFLYGAVNNRFSNALEDYRQLALWVLVLPARELITRDPRLGPRLLIAAVAGCTLASLYGLANLALPLPQQLDFVQATQTSLDTDFGGVGRISSVVPVNDFPIALPIILALIAMRPHSRSGWILAVCFAIIVVGSIADFGRANWFADGAGIALFVVLMRGRLVVPLLTVCGLSVTAFLLADATLHTNLMVAVSERLTAQNLTDPLGLHGIQHRLNEDGALLQLFIANPITGSGLGANITFYSPIWDLFVVRRNWHNDYLFALGKMGIFGLVSLIVLLVAVGLRATSALRAQARDAAIVAVATMAALLPGLIVALTHPVFVEPRVVPLLALLTACVAASPHRVPAPESGRVGSALRNVRSNPGDGGRSSRDLNVGVAR